MKRAPLVLIVIAAASLAWAGSEDVHVTSDPARFLYSVSAFAHGHRHGYEDGFHQADEDLHMGRTQSQIKLTPVKPRGFSDSFGSHGSFNRGYMMGYLQGYRDSAADREFHPLPSDVDLGALLLLSPADQKSFDQGFETGYRSTPEEIARQTRCDLNAHDDSPLCAGVRVGMQVARAGAADANSQVASREGR